MSQHRQIEQSIRQESKNATREEIVDSFVELAKLNYQLSNTISQLTNRLEESKRELLATGWDKGYEDCILYHQSHGLQGTEDNPYRKPIEMSGAES
ncbi:MAG: hypothetical protein ACTHYO_10380 [Micrococcaceae bacterium]